MSGYLHEHTAAPGHATNAAREIGPVDGSMTAADVKAALSMRWPDDRYLHVYEAPLDHGRQGCKIDVLVMGLWASKGHQLDAVEVKVSYSDWCKEWRRVEWVLTDHLGKQHARRWKWREFELCPFRGLDEYTNNYLRAWGREDEIPPEGFEPTIERRQTVDTSKNADWRAHAHRFWIAAPERLAAKIASDVQTIPELAGWGVIAVSRTSTHVLVDPKTNPNRTTLGHRQYLGIIRAAADSGVNAIWRAEARGREAGFKSARMRDEQLRQSMWRSVLWTSAQECAS